MANQDKKTAARVQAERVGDFLRRNGMHHDTIDFDQNVDRFIQEMDRGLKGQGGSLPMIPTYILHGGQCAAQRTGHCH